ncbi:MAG: chloride channel protein [Gammaproteobacteria bacterium]|nr:MAG: chloride channel protein [Gammaproteobacteria bacterium]
MRKLFSLHDYQKRLAGTDALFSLSLLGLASGLGTGLVVLAFRFSFEFVQKAFLPPSDTEGNALSDKQGLQANYEHHYENYEALSSLSHFLLPFIGALLLGLIFHFLKPEHRRVGVIHVLERLNLSHGYLPIKNFVIQFVSGAIAIIFGHSAGREGAAIHLGSAISSLLGQRLALPNNSIRTLVGCGTAAAISASFNTPIAGVIFAVEVVLLEYTISSITPLIIASVAGALVTRAVYGHEPAFTVPDFTLSNFHEIPYLIATGIIIGGLATLFIKNACWVAQSSKHRQVMTRFALAGLITGAGAVIAPQIMGIGYDTVNQTLLGQVPLTLLIIITLVKLSVTSTAVGLGLPTGIIGPTLVIGATAGATIGVIGLSFIPNEASNSGYYAMLGMGAMMGATLRAPLAALTSLMELTASTQIVLPGMLVIVVANLVCNVLFRSQSIFNSLLTVQGIKTTASPLEQLLDRVGVYTLIETNIIRLAAPPETQPPTTPQQATVTDDNPPLILIEENQQPIGLCEYHNAAAAFEQVTSNAQFTPKNQTQSNTNLNAPSALQLIKPIDPQATLREVLLKMDQEQVNWLFICPPTKGAKPPSYKKIYGVVSRQAVVDYYSRHNR